jgi:hypothetical protein
VTQEIADFAERARRYCRFVEGAASLSLDERLRVARELLAELVQAGCRVPLGEPDGPEADRVQPPPGWPGFGEVEIYWEVFDPYEEAPLVAGSLSDDVLDVYCDVRRGLQLFDEGHLASAAFEWRLHFDSHWGDHAVDALRALQRACTRGGRP